MCLLYLHIGIGVLIAKEESLSHPESWDYVHALYFWVVTFLTVGFGDYTLNGEGENQYFPYILIGYILIAGFVCSVVTWNDKRKGAFCHLKEIAEEILEGNYQQSEVQDMVKILDDMRNKFVSVSEQCQLQEKPQQAFTE